MLDWLQRLLKALKCLWDLRHNKFLLSKEDYAKQMTNYKVKP